MHSSACPAHLQERSIGENMKRNDIVENYKCKDSNRGKGEGGKIRDKVSLCHLYGYIGNCPRGTDLFQLTWV
jgi:hypothetical protein